MSDLDLLSEGIVIDVRDLQRSMSLNGIDPDSLEHYIAQYLTKCYGVPTSHKVGFPIKPPILSYEDLDSFFQDVDLVTLIGAHYNKPYRHETDAIKVSVKRSYLVINV